MHFTNRFLLWTSDSTVPYRYYQKRTNTIQFSILYYIPTYGTVSFAQVVPQVRQGILLNLSNHNFSNLSRVDFNRATMSVHLNHCFTRFFFKNTNKDRGPFFTVQFCTYVPLERDKKMQNYSVSFYLVTLCIFTMLKERFWIMAIYMKNMTHIENIL